MLLLNERAALNEQKKATHLVNEWGLPILPQSSAPQPYFCGFSFDSQAFPLNDV